MKTIYIRALANCKVLDFLDEHNIAYDFRIEHRKGNMTWNICYFDMPINIDNKEIEYDIFREIKSTPEYREYRKQFEVK